MGGRRSIELSFFWDGNASDVSTPTPARPCPNAIRAVFEVYVSLKNAYARLCGWSFALKVPTRGAFCSKTRRRGRPYRQVKSSLAAPTREAPHACINVRSLWSLCYQKKDSAQCNPRNGKLARIPATQNAATKVPKKASNSPPFLSSEFSFVSRNKKNKNHWGTNSKKRSTHLQKPPKSCLEPNSRKGSTPAKRTTPKGSHTPLPFLRNPRKKRDTPETK